MKQLTHAPAGGHIGLDGKYRRGGEFEPFYVPRTRMPQIDESDLVDLLAFLARHSVHVSIAVVEPNDLRFHQRVFENRVPPLGDDLLDKPLLVSSEGYVLDGNHRATAHKRYGTRPVCFILHKDFLDSMALLFQFPKTYSYGEA